MEKIFAYVGNWGFHPAQKGISIYSYEPVNGSFDLLETIMPEVAAGQLCLDSKKGILYAVNECGDRRGDYGGGGYLMAFKIDAENGHLTLMNEVESLCPEPSYLCLDKSGKYILACHCADPWHVTKVVKNQDGTYGNQVLFDDAGVVLLELNADGSLGAIRDVAMIPGTNGLAEDSQVNVDPVTGHIQLVEVISRLHSVVASPAGEIFVVCDKGMDRIYVFQLDRENGRLIHTDTYRDDWSSFPRYCAFHPTLPILYSNNEYNDMAEMFHVDEKNGKIQNLLKVHTLFSDPGLIEGKPAGAQDIKVHPQGKALYVTMSGVNDICVFTLDGDGVPTLVQNVDCGGDLPRGLAFTPDGRRLICGNMVSGDITCFDIMEDGTISEMVQKFPAVSPSAIQFFEAE